MSEPSTTVPPPPPKRWITNLADREDPEDVPDADKVTYEASCHCRGIQYSVRLPRLTGAQAHNVTVCNCSICTKHASLFVYPHVDNVTFTQGTELMREYSFATQTIKHTFCGNCGCKLFARPMRPMPKGQRLCVNVRMFRGLDLDALNYVYLDGKNMFSPQVNEETF